MLKEQNKIIERVHRFIDMALTAIAFLAACFIRNGSLPEPLHALSLEPSYKVLLLLIIIIWYVVFEFVGLYSPFRQQTFDQIFFKILKGVFAGILILSTMIYVFKLTDISRMMMGIFVILDIIFLTISKWMVHLLLNYIRKNGYNFRNILIVGSGHGAIDVIDAIADRRDSGYRIMGCLELKKDKIGQELKNGVTVINTIESLEQILLTQVVDELIFSIPLNMIENFQKYISLAENVGVSVRILPQWHIRKLGYSPNIGSLHFEAFLGIPTISLITTPKDASSLMMKTLFDYALSSGFLIVLLPLLILLSILVKLTSKGPVFYKQERLGVNGRKFILYKFRTMFVDAEEQIEKNDLKIINEADGPVFKMKKDPRVIPYIGTFLRKTGLDELPQLINVLKGEMSIVGPRPPIVSEVKDYDNWQRRRLSMKPGITCTWQISPKRNEIKFHEWMKMDLDYIDQWSLTQDFLILFKTFLTVFRAEGQ